MPAEVAKLAAEMLHNPVRVEVTPQKITVERIAQSVHHVTIAEKRDLLEKLLRDPALSRVIVFTRTKHRANRVAEQLDKAGIPADAIHGNKSQNARQRALDAFRTRSEEHTSELQSLMRISYAVFCLKKKKTHKYLPQE